jgi:hypothetical protein
VASALRLDPGHEPAHRLRKRVKDVERLKEEGNTAFKGSRLQDAIARYTEALDVRPISFTNTRTDPSSQRIGEIEEEGKGGQIRATLLSNRATTLVKVHPLHHLIPHILIPLTARQIRRSTPRHGSLSRTLLHLLQSPSHTRAHQPPSREIRCCNR